jgi:hypothetical protein
MNDGFPPQCILAPEMIVDKRVTDAGGPGNVGNRGALKS